MIHRYVFDRQYAEVFRRVGIDIGELLRQSHLPEDLFSRRDIWLTREEYFRLITQLGRQAATGDAMIRMATAESLETLIPPVFAAYCSSDGLSFLRRFATYKRLIGPMKITMEEEGDRVAVYFAADGGDEPLPAFFAELEMLFTLAVLRKATQAPILPKEVCLYHPLTDEKVQAYFGCTVARGEQNKLVFTLFDLQRPFTSRNDAMWAYFEPELCRRLDDMELDDSMGARVRSVLVELLPAGKTTVDDVASKLCLSRRTLQRKLTEEQTTFQQQLNSTRLLLATNYIKNGDRTTEDIAFLLGYEDVTSFQRAFNSWTGTTVTEYKRKKK